MIFYCRFLEIILIMYLFLKNIQVHPDFQIYQQRSIQNLFIILEIYPTFFYMFLAFYLLLCICRYIFLLQCFENIYLALNFNSSYHDIFPISCIRKFHWSGTFWLYFWWKYTKFWLTPPPLHFNLRVPFILNF